MQVFVIREIFCLQILCDLIAFKNKILDTKRACSLLFLDVARCSSFKARHNLPLKIWLNSFA